MKALLQHCHEENEELTGILTAVSSIRTSTAKAQNIERAVSERLREVRIMINVRIQEAVECKGTMEDRTKARL